MTLIKTERIQEIIEAVRNKNPLVHHMTNQVVMNFSANGLLAFGGTPAMAKSIEIASDLAAASHALLINIGTLAKEDIPSMIQAGRTANEKGIPVVLDPVGIGISSFNKNAVHAFLKEVSPTAIKGNAGEMAFLAGIPWETKGVDSIGDGDQHLVARKVAEQYDTVSVVTGQIDIICHQGRLLENKTGHPLLTKITGGGCLLGSVLAACLANPFDALDQAYAAVYFYGLAAEYAASRDEVHGPGTFLPAFLDALSFDIDQLKEDQQ